jgi:probable HAF family extracellular repeat protein
MKSKILTAFTTIALLAVLAIPVHLAAQEQQEKKEKAKHHHYKLVDMGTFGGPTSRNDGIYPPLNNQGTVIGGADTNAPDSFYPNFNPLILPGGASDPYIFRAFESNDGELVALDSLPGGYSTWPTSISENGLIAGTAINGAVDPITGWPEETAVLWHRGKVTNLGTLGGYESGAGMVNSRGQVTGFSGNTITDPYSLFGLGTQTRAFLWDERNGMQDIGTLGGPDAASPFINERGQIAGSSYTSDMAVDPFLWEPPTERHPNGKMIDLGSLGGTSGGEGDGVALNNHGQVVGSSNLAGDVYYHPFLWTKPGPMQDLGTLGGNYGTANVINEAGDVAGWATNTGDQALLAFFWKNGKMTNLGTLPGKVCSYAHQINSKDQVTGSSDDDCADGNSHAFLWENGGPMVDLNDLVSGADMTLGGATGINDRGEITAVGVLANGDLHAFLLIPCDENHPGIEGCDYTLADGSATVDVAHAHATNISSPLINSPATTVGQLNRLRGGMLAGAHKRLAPDFHNSHAALSSAPYNLIASALNTYQIRINWQEASGQNQGGFNIYRCHGCPSPRTEGTRIASVGANVLSYTNGSSTSPLTETTTYTYQVTAFNSNGESGPSNASSAPTKTEPAPTNLSSFAFSRGVDDIVDLRWTNNSTDDNSYYVESCTGSTCTNFSTIAQLGANATTDTQYFQFAPDVTLRYRVRAHSPGGYSGYSNIRNQVLP